MSDAERSSVASVNESSFDEDVDQNQASDVQEVKDSGRQRMLKIGGGIGLGVILLIAIIVPCVMLLPKTTTTEAVTTTQAMFTEPSEPTIAPTDPPSTNATISITTEDSMNTTTEKPPLILDGDSSELCNAIQTLIDGNQVCTLIQDVELKACTSHHDECYGFKNNQCYGPPEGGSWEFCIDYCQSGGECYEWQHCTVGIPVDELPDCPP